MEWVIAAMILGLIPGFIAQSKGRSFGAWWLFGFLLFPIALFGVLALHTERCPECREAVRFDARRCKHCGTMLGGDARATTWERTGPPPLSRRALGAVAVAAIMILVAIVLFDEYDKRRGKAAGGAEVESKAAVVLPPTGSTAAPPSMPTRAQPPPEARPAKGRPDPWDRIVR